MAGELRITTSVIVTNGDYFQSRFTPGLLTVVQTGVGSHEQTVLVGTGEEDMPIGDIATEGWLVLRNVHATAEVIWGPKSGASMIQIGVMKPGEWAMFRMSTTATMRWVSTVANSPVQMKLYEN